MKRRAKRKTVNAAKAIIYNSLMLIVCVYQLFSFNTIEEAQIIIPKTYASNLELNQTDVKVDTISQNLNAQFKDASDLMVFYMDCIINNRYQEIVSISKNVTFTENAKRVWESMKCYGGAYEIKTNEKRALYGIVIPVDEPGLSGLPSSNGGSVSILRYLYIRKDSIYWYADGPLHNGYPPGSWWNGEDFSWEIYDYGFSDGKSNRVTISTQEQLDYYIQKSRQEF